MDKNVKITDYHYYPESDELDLVINVDKPQPAVSVLVDDDLYLRLDPDTNQVVGATILNVSAFCADMARAFALKELSNANVRFFFEQKVGSLSPAYA